jgi:hypothetical protein
MAFNPLSLNPSFDQIAIFDSSFSQVMALARPMRGEYLPRAKVMEHPLETGQIISDYKVILPTEIGLRMFVILGDYTNVYQEIKKLFENSELLTIQSKVNVFDNMIISEMPHEERPETFDAIILYIKFKQVQTVSQTPSFAAESAADSNTQDIGQQSSIPLSPFPETSYEGLPKPASTVQSSGAVTTTGNVINSGLPVLSQPALNSEDNIDIGASGGF